MKCSVRMIAIAVCAIAASQAYAQFPGGGAPQGQQQSQTEKWQKILKETELEQKPFTKGEDKLNICQHLYNKDQAGKPAILVFLHGIGERGDNNLAQNELGVSDIVKNIRDQKQKVVLITCQCPSSELWAPLHRGGSGAALQPLPSKSTGLIPDMIEAKIKEFDADPDRIYITGLSMGGYGTWDTISRRPDLFAAAIPICGGADPAQAPVLKNMAISIFHGDRDNLVPTNLSREMFKALEDAGNKNVKLTIYEGVEHNSWEKAYADPETFKWLFAQKRTEEGKKAKGKVFTEEEINAAKQRGGGGFPFGGGMGGGMPNFGGMGGGMPPMGGMGGGMPNFGGMGGGMPPMGGGQGGMPDFGAMFGGGMPNFGGMGGAPGGAPGGQGGAPGGMGGFPGFGGGAPGGAAPGGQGGQRPQGQRPQGQGGAPGGMGGFGGGMGGFGGGFGGGFPGGGMGGFGGGPQGGGAAVSTVSDIKEKFPEEYKAAQELRQKDPAAYREKMRDLQKKLTDSKEESK